MKGNNNNEGIVCVCLFVFVCLLFFISEAALAELAKEQVELEAVKEEIADVKREIDEVKARVKALEGKAERDEEEKEELRHKRSIYDKLLANNVELRKEKARLEERQQQSREEAGTRFFFPFFLFVSQRVCFSNII